jgi:hypothetical protein
MNQLQIVCDTLEKLAQALPIDKSTVKTCYAVNDHHRDSVHQLLAIVKGMMQAEPVAFGVIASNTKRMVQVFIIGQDDHEIEDHSTKYLTPLFAAPQAVPAGTEGKTCSNCTFHYKDIDMEPCSNCERGDNISDNWIPMSTGQIALEAAPAVKGAHRYPAVSQGIRALGAKK